MAAKEAFFKQNHNILGGYYIPVRNNWNYKLKNKHLTEKEKEIYERDFGEEIISEDEYFNWWKKLHANT